MKKIKIIVLVLCIITLVLEILPWGAVLNFMKDPGESVPYVRKTYSYFSLTPFGYANFSPFICAILSVVLAIIHTLCVFVKHKKGVYSLAATLNAIAILLSITPPLMFGFAYYSVIGLMITVLLTALFVLTCHINKRT